ncbi:MAG TPA: DUF116 domain-containing protein [Planctomycetota bacterium]|nr:DUF116 domain-containing protein [Planctomycetota bacterium]HUV38517.1 DUF116 domain-containing protein [Planctomycetota bacterium]
MSRILVGLSNLLTHLRRTRVKPDELLLLFPACLQCSECPQNVLADLVNCKRCGKCKVSDLRALAEKYGCRIEIASGGHLALAKVRDPGVRAVVAVACSKELRQGILASFPKAVVGVVNVWTKGPCKDTDVDLDEVEGAIRWLLRE